MRIAVVGAGIAGLACARGLVDRGHDVVVFESNDAPGGRIATLKTELGGFDHGAQYFRARGDRFAGQVDRWIADGTVAIWHARPLSFGDVDRSHRAATRYVGVPGMAAIASRMAAGLALAHGKHVTALERDASRWWLRSRAADASATDEDDDAIDGPFDAVVVALPPIRAAALMAGHGSLVDATSSVAIDPCWTLLTAFVEPIGDTFDADAAFIAGSRLAWIARESSKPGRRSGERWTAQATPAWSVEHFDDDPDDVTAKLIRAFQDVTGTHEQPLYAHVHRWREARVRTPAGRDDLWDAAIGLGACGDWCLGHRVEDAWTSGRSLADAIG